MDSPAPRQVCGPRYPFDLPLQLVVVVLWELLRSVAVVVVGIMMEGEGRVRLLLLLGHWAGASVSMRGVMWRGFWGG
jgi:hypothetical protein